MMMPRNILITGATRGLGLAFAERLAKRGHNIFLTDISNGASSVYGEAKNPNDITSRLCNLAPDHGTSQFHFASADLTKHVEALRLIKAAWGKLGYLDVVIANAGGDIVGLDEDASGGKPDNNSSQISPNQHKEVFDRNYLTCWNTLTPVAPFMAKRGFGKLITLSSVNASFGMSTETAYSAAKAAVVHLTRSMASEWRDVGISANCLMLGPTRTGRFVSTLANRSPHDLEAFSASGRLTRIASTDDAADVMEFLVEEKSDYISGQVLRVDGGRFPQPV